MTCFCEGIILVRRIFAPPEVTSRYIYRYQFLPWGSSHLILGVEIDTNTVIDMMDLVKKIIHNVDYFFNKVHHIDA